MYIQPEPAPAQHLEALRALLLTPEAAKQIPYVLPRPTGRDEFYGST